MTSAMASLPPIQEHALVMESARRASVSARPDLQATSVTHAHADTTSPAIHSVTDVSQSTAATNVRVVLTATGQAHCAGSNVSAMVSTLTNQMCAADTELAPMASHCSAHVPATQAGRVQNVTSVQQTLRDPIATSASPDSLDQSATKRFVVVDSTMIPHWHAARMASAKFRIQKALKEYVTAKMAILALIATRRW